MSDPAVAAGPPVFVAAGARSGSTLLRWLLDAHPDLACPGETDPALLLEAHDRSAAALAPPGRPPAPGRPVVDGLVAPYLAAAGATRWCDKSLSNALHLDRLADTWPDARFLLLHRHVMDVVDSGLEASVWGMEAYGFAPYVQMSPVNPVVALVGYWIERASALLAFEERRPDRCLRLRYEDLVAGPDGQLARVWDHLDLPPGPPAAEAYAADHDPRSAADYKIWFEDAVGTGSVGRGARVPADRVPPAVRASVNDLLGRLGYPTVGDRWGAGDDGAGPPVDGADPDLVEVRAVVGHRVVRRWWVDPRATPWRTLPAGTDAGRVVVVEEAAVGGLVEGTTNVGAAVRARRVRHYGPPLDGYRDERRLFGGLPGFLAGVQSSQSSTEAAPDR